MLQPVELYSALGLADRNNLFNQLQSIYNNLPETTCEGCATCCKWGSPPAFFIEYLNMYKYLRDNMKDKYKEILEKSTEYFYLELVDASQACPFLNEENKCSVYSVRPFTCRSFGLLSQQDFEIGDRSLRSLAEKYWEEYNIKISDELVNSELAWCGKVASSQGAHIEKSILAGLAAQISTIDYKFFPQDLVDQEGTLLPYPTHMMNTVLGAGARARKIKVMKEFSDQGTKELLNTFIEKARSYQF
ncbi:YkgJ family cysteine cluster protein [Desulforamulus aquiferis]|uniref:YkgJ family cysteine cluster protein n=1 Tax=Desulforamulus aquiferis TaxID=1397668 RepID=A0AAW7ZBX0_9FIRM|nr:YkgJ family cysteine cluster protein [Desulforamulus aquiferis]MDO7787025.1 YkgJ family cysteine cluster protein [Desulforamulus aquiferis]RYD03799.1 hypothetical protein N752_17065 [Desulforamulus aquiferis]